MEPLRLKPRQPMEDEIENWDDDEDFVVEGDELSFQSSFTTTTGFPSSHAVSRPSSRRRDSTSSHVSFRSELESVIAEETQLHLPGDDETSTLDAIAAAEHAGIPLPKNIPSSALMGGTIKRLGGRKIKKIIQEDWETDLEFPDTSQALSVKLNNNVEFPATLRQVSGGSTQSSPSRKMGASVLVSSQTTTQTPSLGQLVQPNTDAPPSVLNVDNLEDIRDDDDDDDDDGIFGDSLATVKIPKEKEKLPSSQSVSFTTPPTPTEQRSERAQEPYDDDFEQDFELPSDGKLRLSTKRDIPRTPSLSFNLDDLDWGEGSLGTRYGGTRRDGRSARSSSASALSPSMSSSMTAESEDETFEGLVLPPGPFNLQERLRQRRMNFSPERVPQDTSPPSPSAPATPAALKKPPQAEPDREDFFDDLDIGDGNFLGRGKLTLHRNIKVKQTQTASPARPKTAVSLTFTNKPIAAAATASGPGSSSSTSQSRACRPSHERAHSTSLEPVYETSGGASGAALWRTSRHSQSRQGHSHQSSVNSLPNSTTTSPGRQFPLSTPRGREVSSKSSFSSLKGEASTTNSQLLKQKRSFPAARALNNMHSKPISFHRPPSRGETTGRPPSGLRPKTPVDRQQRSGFGDVSASLARKPQPFLPAGASQGKSQHVASKTLRQFRRHDSDNAIDFRPLSRAFSRSGTRSPSPHRYKVAADTWERLSKPKNKKHFGNGHELDGFDDLPTSRDSETRYLKQPLSGGTAKATMRNKLYQNIMPDRTTPPAPLTPFSPARTTPTTSTTTQTPRFARDTTASRIARETSLAHRAPSHGPLSAIAGQREAAHAPLLGPRITSNSTQQHSSSAPSLPQATIRSRKKTKRPLQLKPHLIANLNADKDSKVVNGMYYNADTFQWEGNENALRAFDAPLATPTSATALATAAAAAAAAAAATATAMTANHYQTRDKDMVTPRPALITNISATKGVQVVSGMVFDPQNMCWLKLGRHGKARSEATTDTMDGFDALDDEDDVFKDIPDLDDNNTTEEERRGEGGASGRGRISDVKDDWLVGEEFDVGPEFVRRQREEEDRWRKKCEKWVGRGPRDLDMWRWTIRDLVSQVDEFAM
ncbi:hypothetical protein E4U54_002968 [Claviceps lovelessii]|nr:hypothetical protein E4U54_002968 [Claviceps lovelessii]